MLVVRDFRCKECNAIKEDIVDVESMNTQCECGGVAEKIFSVRNTAPNDAAWISSVRDVVDKNPDKPHCQDFLKHPTRSNYENWKKKEGLRHLEPGEKPPQPESRESRKARIKPKLMEKLKEREAVEI